MYVRPRRLFSGAILFVVSAFLPAIVAVAADSPRVWLERMSKAVELLNYSGTLVHFYGGETSVLKIAHRVDGGRVTEKITSDDAGREIIRNDDEVTCIFRDQKVVLVERRDDLDRDQSPLRGRLPGNAEIRETYYHVAFAGTERIAGRNARIITIRPKDGYRYGYRVSVDRETAMPLKTQLVDEKGQLLEQILFSDIDLADRIPDEAVRPSIAIDTFAVRRSQTVPGKAVVQNDVDWGAVELPAGFSLAVRQARTASDADRGLRHLVYSDGLATVSLFIEPAVAAAEQAEGLSQIGAANAYTTVRDGHMVTAVGEVPARTVEILALSARPGRMPQPTKPTSVRDASR